MNSSIVNLSPKQLRDAASIKADMEDLQRELHRILAQKVDRRRRSPREASGRVVPFIGGKKRRRKMSASARAKIAAAAKERWKKAKAAGKTTL